VKTVAVSQRVDVDPKTGERRDALDRRWTDFLIQCGLVPLAIPNGTRAARELLENHSVHGILLTGGNDLMVCGGDAPERDQTELSLLEHSVRYGVPLLGVCRGMQLIQHFFGISLTPIEGHVASSQTIRVNGEPAVVNSYHRFGTTLTRRPLEAWAFASDGVVKAVRHESLPIRGIMWHPERFEPFRKGELGWVGEFLKGAPAAV
jgi:putative glutamine amidotransferase